MRRNNFFQNNGHCDQNFVTKQLPFSLSHSPTVFHFNYPLIVRHLACYILRTFPTYELNQSNSIGLEELVNQHYLTKLFILSRSNSKLDSLKEQIQ